MANTLTNLQDIRISQAFLDAFRAALQPLRAFSTDFSAEFLERGKTVNVPVVGNALPTSSDFAGSYSQNADRTVTTIPVMCNRHKVRSFHLTDKEAAESSFIRLERLRRITAPRPSRRSLRRTSTQAACWAFAARARRPRCRPRSAA